MYPVKEQKPSFGREILEPVFGCHQDIATMPNAGCPTIV
jgi:hypothetical protein